MLYLPLFQQIQTLSFRNRSVRSNHRYRLISIVVLIHLDVNTFLARMEASHRFLIVDRAAFIIFKQFQTTA